MVDMSSIPLRIAAVSLHTSPVATPGSADAGGMNVVVLEQARALAEAGHDVDLMTRRADPDTPRVQDLAPHLRLLTLDAGPADVLAKSAMEPTIAPFTTSLEQVVTRAESDGRPYDLVHSHHWFSGVAALPVARRHHLPHLQSFHSVAAPAGARALDAGESAESGGRIPGERRAAQESDLVVAVSRAEARTVQERYAVPADRITVVPPGVDTMEFRPSRRSATERLREPELVFAARLQPLKAPDLALEVLARLDPALGAHLALVGSVSQDFARYQGELADRARVLGIQDRVRFVGAEGRTALATRMRRAAVLLLPSWSETFGLVALEAQASGTPVVAWEQAGGVHEAVGPGSRLLTSRDADVWAEAVESLVHDVPSFHEAARGARAFAETRTWTSCADRLARAYDAVTSARPQQQHPSTTSRQESP
jgi:D-inositol-3-phosphate glycosyltransferase